MGMNNISGTVIYFVVIFAVFYFILIRPQQKRQKEHKELVTSLKVNDEVITAGGIFGTITRVKDNSVWLKVADKVEIEILKSSIGNKNRPEEKK